MPAGRAIDREWVGRTLIAPDQVEPDPPRPGRLRAFLAIPARDKRILRVVFSRLPDGGCKVVTAFLDKGEATVKIKHDAGADTLDVRFVEMPVADGEEVLPGVVVDDDANGRIVAIEVLDATERVSSGADLSRLTVA